MTSRTGIQGTEKSGFSLIELSLVVLIMSIIVVVSAPKFRNTYETIKFRNTAYNVVKLMNYARDRAIIERKPFRVHFFEDDMSFCLETLPDEKEQNTSRHRRASEPEFEMVKGTIGKKIYFPRDVTYDIDEPSRAEYITFYPDGQADECVIYIEGKNDITFTITTKKMVGLVRLYREKKRL
jgi:prepilin-type N-terminal cleavage/methylation domain-containing protein